MGILCSEMIRDVQDVIDDQKTLRSATTGHDSASFFDDYRTTEEVFSYMDSLVKEFPNEASVSSIGKTYGGKDIRIIHLSTNRTANKKALWFDGGIHAREWIAVPTVVYIADTLLKNYSMKDPTAVHLLDTFDVIICPIINVDGYDYTWADDGDRMWRKTRSPNAKSPCVGTGIVRSII
jgi:murein tripeptide amidase MpaA